MKIPLKKIEDEDNNPECESSKGRVEVSKKLGEELRTTRPGFAIKEIDAPICTHIGQYRDNDITVWVARMYPTSTEWKFVGVYNTHKEAEDAYAEKKVDYGSFIKAAMPKLLEFDILKTQQL